MGFRARACVCVCCFLFLFFQSCIHMYMVWVGGCLCASFLSVSCVYICTHIHPYYTPLISKSNQCITAPDCTWWRPRSGACCRAAARAGRPRRSARAGRRPLSCVRYVGVYIHVGVCHCVGVVDNHHPAGRGVSIRNTYMYKQPSDNHQPKTPNPNPTHPASTPPRHARPGPAGSPAAGAPTPCAPRAPPCVVVKRCCCRWRTRGPGAAGGRGGL